MLTNKNKFTSKVLNGINLSQIINALIKKYLVKVIFYGVQICKNYLNTCLVIIIYCKISYQL